MRHGILALLERSLRLDARAWSTHLARLGLIVSIYVALCITLNDGQTFGAPGLRFFQGIALLDVVVMTLLGISFFSTAITEEKEEDTLGLMMMAGIGPLRILIGKTGGRLWQAMLLVAVQYPFTLLAVTLGGVTSDQIFAMTLALLAYMIFLAGLGLLCSTIAANSRSAGVLMIVGLVIYFWALPFVTTLVIIHRGGKSVWLNQWNVAEHWWTLLDAIGDQCVAVRMAKILESGFGESPFNLQVVGNIAAGIVCTGLAWLFFGIAIRAPSTEASPRGLLTLGRGRLRFSPGRCWENPFLWKDFHFVAGGAGLTLIRLAFYLGLVAFGWLQHTFFSSVPSFNNDWIIVVSLWFAVCLPIDAALILARSMRDEVQGQTLASLLMLPHSTDKIVYSKFAGSLIGWLPGPFVGTLLLLGTVGGRQQLQWVFSHREGFIVPAIVLFYSLVPHFAALVAMYVRRGAVPIAIGLTFGVYFAMAFVAWVLFWSPIGGGPGDFIIVVAVSAVTVALLVICIACQVGVILRFQYLAER